MTGGGLGDDAGNKGATVARFAAGLAPHGTGTVIAGRDGSATGTAAVAVTRSDAALASRGQHGRRRRRRVRADHRGVGSAGPDQRRPAPGSTASGQGATSVTNPAIVDRRRVSDAVVGVGVRVGFRGSAGPKLVNLA